MVCVVGGRHPAKTIVLSGPYKGCFLRKELTAGITTEDKTAPRAGSVTAQLLLVSSKSQHPASDMGL